MTHVEVVITAATRERWALLEWLRDELAYADEKFAPLLEHYDADMHAWRVLEKSKWDDLIAQYLHRAQVLGVHTPLGRQALAKAWTAVGGALESALRVHGPLPPGGLPSGQTGEIAG